MALKTDVIPLKLTIVNTKDYMDKVSFTGYARQYREQHKLSI